MKTNSSESYSPTGVNTTVKPGFSKRVQSEEVLQALKKNKKIARIGGVIIIPIPLIGFLIYGAVTGMDMGAAFLYGLCVSAIFALVALIAAIKNKTAAPFVGTVDRKKRTFRVENSRRNGKSTDKWLIYFDCEDGKTRKKEVTHILFNYLEEGDRVRYLPQFPQPYEKYDKTEDGYVLCMFCSHRVTLDQDTCPFCHNPVIK